MAILVCARFRALFFILLFSVSKICAQNALTPLDSALIACYSFSGNAADSSGNANHGMVNGATLVNDRFGNFSSAYTFNGNNQNIIIPGFSNKISGSEFSISFWAAPAIQATRSAFLLSPDDTYNRLNIHVYYLSQTIWDFGDLYTNGRLNISSGPLPGPNNWDHWVFVVSVQNNLMACYLNGQLYGSKTGASTFSNALQKDLLIGGGVGSGNSHFWFQGSLDDIKIYRRRLSATNVSNLYNNPTICKNCASSAQPVNATPSAGLNICDGQSTQLFANSTTPISWYIDPQLNLLIGTGNTINVAPQSTGPSVTYYAASTNSCNQRSSTAFVVNLNPCLSVDALLKDETDATIFPNPNMGVLTLFLSTFEENMDMHIFSATGQLVHHLLIKSEKTVIDLKNVAPGIYYLRLTDKSGKLKTQKMAIN